MERDLLITKLMKSENRRTEIIPFKSPLTKGDSGGCVFSGLFYNPILLLYPPPEGDKGEDGGFSMPYIV